MTAKTESEIRQKLKQVRFRHLKREMDQRLRVAPRNCIHNKTITVNERDFGFCVLKQVICDDSPRLNLSEDCPNFSLVSAKDEIKAEFVALNQSPLHEIAAKYPDIAALSWVVGNEDGSEIMPGSTLVGSFGGVLLWADDKEQAESAATSISNLVSAGEGLGDLEGQIRDLAAQVEVSSSQLDKIEAQIEALHLTLHRFSLIKTSTKPSGFLGWLRSWF